MRQVITKDGDMLDAICKVELGSEKHLGQVLDVNPGLAELGPVYSAGLTVFLPTIAEPVQSGEVRLWGTTP